jgi:hypothetical protein
MRPATFQAVPPSPEIDAMIALGEVAVRVTIIVGPLRRPSVASRVAV